MGEVFPLQMDDFEEEGLYLFFPDGSRIGITRRELARFYREMSQDNIFITPEIRDNPDFAVCHHCLGRGSDATFCTALMPVLPLLEEVDKYVSYEHVMAVFKNRLTGFITLKNTKLQEALKYISLLSLTRYCRINRKYWKYFFGVRALSSPQQVVSHIYLNFYWLNNGDEDKTRREIHTFVQEIKKSAEGLVDRLRVICKNDAFLNAFVNTQIIPELLYMNKDTHLKTSLEKHEKDLVSLK